MRNGLLILGLTGLLAAPASGADPADGTVPAGAATQPAPAAPTTRPTTAPAPPGGPGTFDPGRDDPFAGRTADTSGLMYRMLAYTLIILVLGVIALLVVKKVLPRITASAGKRISVLETAYLGPRKTLHLLQVGSQRFLVAGSRDRITLLGEVTGAFADEDEAEAAPTGGGRFASILRRGTARADATAPAGEARTEP